MLITFLVLSKPCCQLELHVCEQRQKCETATNLPRKHIPLLLSSIPGALSVRRFLINVRPRQNSHLPLAAASSPMLLLLLLPPYRFREGQRTGTHTHTHNPLHPPFVRVTITRGLNPQFYIVMTTGRSFVLLLLHWCDCRVSFSFHPPDRWRSRLLSTLLDHKQTSSTNCRKATRDWK